MADGGEYLDTTIRIRKWAEEGLDLLGRVIPSVVEEWEHLRRETVQLRSYVVTLQEDVDRLQRQRGAIAKAAEACLSEIGRIANESIEGLKTLDQANSSDHGSSSAPRDGPARRKHHST